MFSSRLLLRKHRSRKNKFRNMFSSALGFYCAKHRSRKKFRNMFSPASTHIRKGSQKEQRKHSQKKLCQALQAAGQSHLVHALVIPIGKSQALQAAGQSHFVHVLVETQAKLLPSVRLLDLGILSKNRQSPIRAHNF